MDFVFFIVNEDGYVYEQHNSFESAQVALEQFPNDTIVVAVVGSPIADRYSLMDIRTDNAKDRDRGKDSFP
jgi:hypothetical protein